MGQVWYLIVSIPDLCTLTYFLTLTRNALLETIFVILLIFNNMHATVKKFYNNYMIELKMESNLGLQFLQVLYGFSATFQKAFVS